jgi:predicted Rossmann-fold nucleotide-binding protein
MTENVSLQEYIPDIYNIGNIVFHKGVVYPNVKAQVFRKESYPFPPDPIVVAIFGSSKQGYTLDQKIARKYEEAAFETGRQLARYRGENGRRIVCTTGFCPGYPHEAARGIREEGGFVVGVTATRSQKDHLELLKTTLKNDRDAIKLFKEQEELYNVALYPQYKLPKEAIALKKLASQELEESLQVLQMTPEELAEKVRVVNLETVKNGVTFTPEKLIELYKRNKFFLESCLKLTSDYCKNMLKWRNALTAELSDAAICIDGSAGTLMEMSTLYHSNHSILGLWSPNVGMKFENIQNKNTADVLYLFHQEIGKIKQDDQTVIYTDNIKFMIEELVKAWEKREKNVEWTQTVSHYIRSDKFVGENSKILMNSLLEKNLLSVLIGLGFSMKYYPSIDRSLTKKVIEPLESEMKKKI